MKNIIVLAALVATQAHAEFLDGNQLLSRMNGNTIEQSLAIGYVIGVADTLRGVQYCPTSASITSGQASDVVKIYLESVPQHRHLSADVLTAAALGRVWPCPQKNGKSL